MGWFWADAPARAGQNGPQYTRLENSARAPPSGCPMHKKTVDAFSGKSKCQKPTTATPSSCPVPHGQRSSPSDEKPKSILSQLNPLNYMFPDLSQAPAPNQTYKLPTSREESSIPKAEGSTTWEYPSPQQMYNALLRKGYEDTDITAVEDMVNVHNFLNEGAWREVVGWEARFGAGLLKGFQICKRGEENALEELPKIRDLKEVEPTLIRFQGRPKDMTPKAAFWQLLSKIQPDWFGVEPPFDRHDWYVSRKVNGETKEVRYVIDYYSGPPEPTGEPVFFLDVRPAMTPSGAAERLIRWGTDAWWRGSGGAVREEKQNRPDNE